MSVYSLLLPRISCRPVACMIFRAAGAVNDLRPFVTARSPSERVIDSARRPAPRAAKRSTERSGCTDTDSLFAPGMIEVSARMLSGVSAFKKFFAARKQYHDDPRARRRDLENTAMASLMRFLVVIRTNPRPEFGLLLCIVAHVTV
jgi:hypothetical protein